jgi:hypothetical protein
MKKKLLFGMLTLASLAVNAQTTIFNETFDSGTGTSMPNGWIRTSIGSSSGNLGWRVYSMAQMVPMGFSGKVIATQALSADNLLYSPDINLVAGSTYTLTFQVASNTEQGNYASDNNYAVYVVPAATGVYDGTQTPVFQELLTVADAAQARTVDLSAYAGQNIRLVFRHYNTSARSLVFDNVKVTQQSVLGTSEASVKNQVAIYPNPTTDYINVKAKYGIINTEIYDATGRKVSSQFNTDKVDVRNLQTGNYIINIETKEGKTSGKFIKK